MKSVLLTGQKDAVIGFRLAGIAAEQVQDSSAIIPKVKQYLADDDIGIILITDDIASPVYEDIMALKLVTKQTIILTIPSPGEPFVDRIGAYIGQSIGIKY